MSRTLGGSRSYDMVAARETQMKKAISIRIDFDDDDDDDVSRMKQCGDQFLSI